MMYVNLLVTRATFLQLVELIKLAAFEHDCRLPGSNAFVDMPVCVAMTLAYLAQEGGFSATASCSASPRRPA